MSVNIRPESVGTIFRLIRIGSTDLATPLPKKKNLYETRAKKRE